MAVDFSGAPICLFFLTLASVLAVILGALAWSRTSSLSLPLPTWLPALVTLLSPLTAAALAFIRTDSRTANFSNTIRYRIVSIIDQLHSIVLSVIATVALAYLFPDNILACHLEQQWQAYFQAKSSQPIRAIQDNFQCCGFRSIHDRAWPFKDRTHGDDTCELQLGYHRSCLEPWGGQQQSASWMIFAAAVLIWAIKIGFVQFGNRRPSWMNVFTSRREGGYQRITHPEAQEEGDDDEEDAASDGRTTLPHSGPTYSNVWEER